MSVGLLIITHNNIGKELLDTATIMLETCPLPAATLNIGTDSNLEKLIDKARKLQDKLDSGDGLLILTDMYGSTPSNIAHRLLEQRPARVITGVNLPMLIRVLNYPRLTLEQLAEKARSGGHDGIMICNTK